VSASARVTVSSVARSLVRVSEVSACGLQYKVKISTLAGRNLRYLPAQKKRECGSSLRMTLTSPGMQPGASSPSHSKMNC